MAGGWLTVKEAADFLAVSIDTLGRWRSEGKGPPFFKFEGGVRYGLSDIEAWLNSRRVEPR